MSAEPTQRTTWWGTFGIERGQARRWRIGPLTLWIDNPPAEWRVAYRTDTNPDAAGLEVAAPIDVLPEDVTLHRFASPADESAVRLLPRVPDRSMVVRPDMPIVVLGGEEMSLFTSIPLWVVVQTAKTERTMVEVAASRPQDTWFGPTTCAGELAYAMRTRARLALDAVPVLPNRALTKVTLRNLGRDAMPIERLNLPVTSLAVHAGAEGALWLPAMLLERDAEGEVGRLHVDPGPPREAGPTTLVGPPRAAPRGSVLVRTLSLLWR